MTTIDTPARRPIASTLLCPPRPALREAIAIADEVVGDRPDDEAIRERLGYPPVLSGELAREVWETFATRGLIPEAWADDDPARRFRARVTNVVRHRGRRAGLYIATEGDAPSHYLGLERMYVDAPSIAEWIELASPVTLIDAITLASDAAGVALAEQLAREAAGRCALWEPATGSATVHRATWRVIPRVDRGDVPVSPAFEQPRWYRLGAALLASLEDREASAAVREQLARKEAFVGADGSFARGGGAPLLAWRTYASRWAILAQVGAVVRGPRATLPEEMRWSEELVGRAFAELPNPFAPLRELYRCGYALEAIEDGVVRLVASRA